MVDETYALNAAVYTSLADIEGEANGMATYDREASPHLLALLWTPSLLQISTLN